MSTRVRNAVTIVLLFAAAIASWYFARTSDAPIAESAGPASAEVGYQLIDASILGHSATGELLYRIAAERMDEMPEDDTFRLSAVDVVYEDAESVQWNVSATEASIPIEGGLLDLFGQVTLENPARNERKRILVETTELRLDADNYLATTAEPIRFVWGDSSTVAVGLRVDLRSDGFEMGKEAHVRIDR